VISTANIASEKKLSLSGVVFGIMLYFFKSDAISGNCASADPDYSLRFASAAASPKPAR